jgi:hypothetical protein
MSIIVREPPKKVKPKANAYRYAWVKIDDEYCLDISPDDWIHIWQLGHVWKGNAKLKGRTYTGERPTLEACFKALDKIFYKCYASEWVKTDVQAVIGPWKGDLNLG